ncbi:MAG: peroxiredoxin family protein, partial [Verrucomicrobiota bacterium]
FETGDLSRGREQLAGIEARLTSWKEKQEEVIQQAEEKSKDKKDAEKKKALDAAKKPLKGTIESAEKAVKELTAYELVFAEEPNIEEAGKALDEAKGIGKGRKSRLFYLLGETEKALKLAGEEAKAAKNQVQPLAHYVHLLQEAGKKKEANVEMKKLRSLASSADLHLPVFQRLKDLGEEDWRSPVEPSQDLGARPSLASMGPFRWQPPKAPVFALKNAMEETISLADYEGKPVLMIFFLGRGCVHCMEQLGEFAPMDQQFEEAGIEVLAVSTDTVEGLREIYWDDGEAKRLFPFPLLSDHELTAFRAYRAYDDFEEIPLHGTFLIDEAGRLRWHSISHEPLMHPEFALEESLRLLSFEDS